MKNTMDVGGPKIEPKRPVDEDEDFEEESLGPNRSTVKDEDEHDDDPTCLFALSIFVLPII